LQVRSEALFLDQTITPTGFAGAEDTDWGDIWEKALLPINSVTIVSATVEDSDPSDIRLTLSQTIDTLDFSKQDDFTFTVNGAPVAIIDVDVNVDPEYYILTLADAIVFGDVVTFDHVYSDSLWSWFLSMDDTVPLEDYADYAVTNNVNP